MKVLKVIALIFVISFVSCDPVNEFLDNVIQGLQFLADVTKPIEEEGTITLTDCSSNPIFKITGMKVKPNKIEKGGSMSILVVGKMLEEEHVKELAITTTLNEKPIFADSAAKDAVVAEGKTWKFDYTASVPTFVPAGNWNTQLRLKNTEGVELCCVSASWKI
jgi:hypothetical protein